MERSLGTEVMKGKYTTKTCENRKKERQVLETIKIKQKIRRNVPSPQILIAETIFNTRELGIRSKEEMPGSLFLFPSGVLFLAVQLVT